MNYDFERMRKPLIGNYRHERVGSMVLSSLSNENSPRHHSSSMTPTNSSTYEQSLFYVEVNILVLSNTSLLLVFANRSYPHLSLSNHGASSTIVPTTPVDPSVTNLGLISSTTLSNSLNADDDQKEFKKSTSMRFAKLMEHPSKFSDSIMIS